MIDFLCEMKNFWIWSASLLVLTAILWAVPRTRRMPGILMTGWKTMPAGCAVTVLVPIAGLLLMYWAGGVLDKVKPLEEDLPGAEIIFILSIPFFWFPLGIVSGVLAAAGLYRLLRRHFQAEADPMGFAAVGLFVTLSALAFHILFHYFKLEGRLY